jgi:hypothetical protein
VAKNDRTYVTWNNSPEEANLEDRDIVLECLEAKILGDHDGDHIHGENMPPPSPSRLPDVGALPLASQRLVLHGGHVVVDHVPRTLPPTPAPLLHRSWEEKLEVSHGKRKLSRY